MKFEDIVLESLSILNTLKLYHWRTRTYVEHKVSDELYEELQSHIDDFVENILGMYKSGLSISGKSQVLNIPIVTTKSKIRHVLETYKMNLIKFSKQKKSNSIDNTVDEILVNINKFLYLLKFK